MTVSFKPLVSVVMAVHNGARYLDDALTSLLLQTYEPLEIIVIDDGSTDETIDIIARCHDPRVRILTNESRQGLAFSLNRGIESARGAYIARMDADDVCHVLRIERQVQFMEANPAVGLLGTACRVIDDAGSALHVVRHPSTDVVIRWRLLFAPPVAHPSTMIRGDVLRHHGLRYDVSWPVAQDYELWCRLLRHCRGANLTEVLLDYRIHEQSVSETKRLVQDDWALRVSEQMIGPFFPTDVPMSLLPSLRRALIGPLQANDPPTSYLRELLFRIMKNYISLTQLDHEQGKLLTRQVVASLLSDAAFIRPFNRYSILVVVRSLLAAPWTALCSLSGLTLHFCSRRFGKGTTNS